MKLEITNIRNTEKSKDIWKLKNSPETNVKYSIKRKSKNYLDAKMGNITKFIGYSKSSIQRKDHSNKMPVLRKKKDIK